MRFVPIGSASGTAGALARLRRGRRAAPPGQGPASLALRVLPARPT
jgi:hypothetical protein